MAAPIIGNETPSTKERLLYIDNLRLLVIVLVVTIHVAVTVSDFGSWYYVYGTHLDTLSTVWFAFYQSFTQGYFLGLLFLISGYFIAGSYDRKGFGVFVRDRFKRLIIQHQNNMFAKISYQAGKRWLISAIVLGFVVWFVLVVVATATGSTAALQGGLTWQSAGFSVWESFVAIVMSIGLIVVFREKLNHQSKLVKTLSENSFAVYMFHPMIIVPVTLLFSPLALYPIAKWLLLCMICVPLCFAAMHFIFRNIPLQKNVL